MTGKPLFVLLCSGDHEKLQMAGMMASVAAVSERPVTVFVSMNAIFAFRKDHGDAYVGGAFSKLMKDKVPDAITLFQQGRVLADMKIHPCSMAMDVAGWKESDMVEDLLDEAAGLTKFLSDAEDGQLVVV